MKALVSESTYCEAKIDIAPINRIDSLEYLNCILSENVFLIPDRISTEKTIEAPFRMLSCVDIITPIIATAKIP